MVPRRWGVVLIVVSISSAASAEPLPPYYSTWVLAGSAQQYEPPLSLRWKEMSLAVPFSLGGRVEGTSVFPIDRYGTSLGEAAVDLQARVGVKLNTRRALVPFNIAAEYEHDLITGVVVGEPTVLGEGLPNSRARELQLRKAYARVSLGTFVHLIGGLTTSHWGLGLVANDGSRVWEPGSAAFVDPRGGDRVLRVAIATGPLTPLGISAAFAHDWVRQDDALLPGDSARQFAGSITIGTNRPTSVGFYAVYRVQQAASGRDIKVTVLDLHASTTHALGRKMRLTVEAEAAVIIGSTGLGPSPELPRKDIFQIGGALRARLERRRLGAVLDLVYASGDASFDDAQQNAFRADPNFEMGLMLFRYVLTGQTGRAPITAADPTISGYPPLDLDRLPTRGSVSNTYALFPRIYARPIWGLEIYTGPLFAFSAAKLADPFNSKDGGTTRNALNGTPSTYLGTEIDLGARFRALLAGTELTLGLEGGLLLLGGAFAPADKSPSGVLACGRTLLRYRF